VVIRPEKVAQFGWAATVSIRVDAACEGRGEAYAALAAMLGPIWR
jgi:hypothetical protein